MLRKIIKEIPNSQAGFLTSKEIENVFSKALATEKLKLNTQQLEYLLFRLFEDSNDLNSLNYNKIFQFFKK